MTIQGAVYADLASNAKRQPIKMIGQKFPPGPIGIETRIDLLEKSVLALAHELALVGAEIDGIKSRLDLSE